MHYPKGQGSAVQFLVQFSGCCTKIPVGSKHYLCVTVLIHIIAAIWHMIFIRMRCDDDDFYHAIACNATHGIAKAFLSICLSNTYFLTKWKKLVPTFLYHMKDHSSLFFDKKKPPVPKIFEILQPVPKDYRSIDAQRWWSHDFVYGSLLRTKSQTFSKSFRKQQTVLVNNNT